MVRTWITYLVASVSILLALELLLLEVPSRGPDVLMFYGGDVREDKATQYLSNRDTLYVTLTFTCPTRQKLPLEAVLGLNKNQNLCLGDLRPRLVSTSLRYERGKPTGDSY